MKKVISIFYIFISIYSSAQKQGNIWYFSDSCGLDFSNGIPVELTNGGISNTTGLACEGNATISDSAGNLLFYADAVKVWNKNHQIMPNGSGLMGGASSTQGAFIIPQPGSDHLYYLFTTDEYQHNLQNGLRYNIIDMCLNYGLGDVVSTKKNILLLDTVSEKMAGTNHANGADVWLVVHKYFSDAFYAYRISSNGIIETVISHVGSTQPHPGDNSYDPAIGQLKISPDGTKLALVFSNTTPCVAELFNFNNSTGLVSNAISLPTDGGEYGVSFSPDNSKLYISSANAHVLFQYDLSAGNSSAIIASKTLVYFAPFYTVTGMQLGPNGKIYVVDNYRYLDVINNPNALGVTCNYVPDATRLLGPKVYWSLPNFIDSFSYPNTIVHCNIEVKEIDK